jgi:hydrogenase expression/formation protein HypE
MKTCPLPIQDHPSIMLSHGGGGRKMHELIEKLIVPAFSDGRPSQHHDGEVLKFGDVSIAFTTDSYVVHPLFFPGGDIGRLAVHGTINDLAMCGARATHLSCGLILEEGLPMETLQKVIQSMADTAKAAGVQFVTGDTKVVDKGKCDGMFINTAGIGILERPVTIRPSEVKAGDAVLLSGDLGRHGIAIMAVREGLSFETVIESDTAPLWNAVDALFAAGIEVHCLRDLTRGGLSSALNEIAEVAKIQVNIDETMIPVREDVRGACELLGLDPLYVANEGRFVAFVKGEDASQALQVLRGRPDCPGAELIGQVVHSSDGKGLVTLRSRIGAVRLLDMLVGEQLPRIC